MAFKFLRSDDTREDIATRLTNELERLNAVGELTEAGQRQAAGKAPALLVSGVDRSRFDQREANARRRGLPQDDRAGAFLTLPIYQAVRAHPEMVPAYASLEAIKRQLETSGLADKEQAFVLDRARHAATERIAKNDIPSVEIKETCDVDRSDDRAR